MHAEQTPPLDEIKTTLNHHEDVTRIDFYLSCVEKVKIFLFEYTRYFAGDDYFAKKKFVDGIVGMGLGNCQSRNKESLYYHFNMSFMSLNIVKIQEQIDYPNLEKQVPFSMASYKTRYHNESMISIIFSMLGFDLSSIKLKPVYQKLLNYGAISFR